MKKIKIKKRTKKTNIKSNDKGNLSAFKRRFKKGNSKQFVSNFRTRTKKWTHCFRTRAVRKRNNIYIKKRDNILKL